MKTKLTFLLSLTFLFLFSGSVYGGSMSGQRWMKFCESPEPIDSLLCTFYLEGIKDMYELIDDKHIDSFLQADGRSIPLLKSCIPKGVDLEQQRLIMIKYLKDNPEKLHYEFSGLYQGKMTTTFPCK